MCDIRLLVGWQCECYLCKVVWDEDEYWWLWNAKCKKEEWDDEYIYICWCYWCWEDEGDRYGCDTMSLVWWLCVCGICKVWVDDD